MKETKPKAQPSRDPEITGFSYDEFFNNQLTLSQKLQESLKKQGLTWRFINAQQFRSNGNVHRSHWKVHIFTGEDVTAYGCSPEGVLQRGDLVLATRTNQVADAHRKFLKQRNKLQSNAVDHQKKAAEEIRAKMREAGLEAESKILQGYDDNE